MYPHKRVRWKSSDSKQRRCCYSGENSFTLRWWCDDVGQSEALLPSATPQLCALLLQIIFLDQPATSQLGLCHLWCHLWFVATEPKRWQSRKKMIVFNSCYAFLYFMSGILVIWSSSHTDTSPKKVVHQVSTKFIRWDGRQQLSSSQLG